MIQKASCFGNPDERGCRRGIHARGAEIEVKEVLLVSNGGAAGVLLSKSG